MKEREDIHERLQAMGDNVNTIKAQYDRAKTVVIEKKKTHRGAVVRRFSLSDDLEKNPM